MKNLFVVLVLSSFVYCTIGNAGTLFRLPLASNPGYAAWFDHDATGGLLRYDCATNFQYNDHHGTDFAVGVGTPVYAAAIGELYYRLDTCAVGNLSCGGGFGNHVRIRHLSDGKVSIYAHLSSVGFYQSIICGGQVGLSGNTGHSTGPHLHFEVWSDQNITQRIDPYGGSCSNGGVSLWKN